MNIAEKQHNIIKLIIEGQIARAIPMLSELVYSSHQGDYISSLENLENTYRNILKYSFSGTPDPERENIYSNLKRGLVELCDSVAHYIEADTDEWYKGLKREDSGYLQMSEREKSALIEELTNEREFARLFNELQESESTGTSSEKGYTQTLNKVFEILWLKGRYAEGEKQLAIGLLENKDIPWYDKALVVSAISISLFKEFDLMKIELLFDVYENQENQVYQRALVGLIFAFLLYQDRLPLYSEITNWLKSISNPDKLAERTEQIIIQLIKSQETEQVTEKIQKEILPEVMKMKPDIEEKLKLDDLLSADEMEDKNPDWEDFFSESPGVYQKLEEFSNMQMDGSDVFMGAFSMLKRFGFFDQFSNWFLPFYKEHPEVRKSVSNVDTSFDWNTFFEGIEKAPVLCNSDKYSFCFNIGFMPDMQKSMMLEMFSMELQQMSEVAKDENKNSGTAVDKTIFTQYIQDLYRFYKLHPKRYHFPDVFGLKLKITSIDFLEEIFATTDNLRKIGEFYFNKNYYSSALKVFLKLNNDSESFELSEKIGFCYQKLEQYSKAIDAYQKAEIIDSSRTWLQKKLGYCYKKTGQLDKAIAYYQKVEKADPDNLEIQVYLGQLHIEKEDYDKAFQYYFKVEYLQPNFVKAQRPIAWCSFLVKKPEQAVNYYKKVIEKEGTRSDYLNLAHAYWAVGKLSDAINSYRLALKHSGGNTDWFRESMQKDAIHLKGYAIDELEVALMTDYLLLDI